jgi:hypothetical protein
VDTVEALRSALASEADVQLVVSNHLLDTPEFRALMHSLDTTDQLSGAASLLHLQEEESNSSSSSHFTRYSHEESRDGLEATPVAPLLPSSVSGSSSISSRLPNTSCSNSILSSVTSASNESSMMGAESIVDDDDDEEDRMTLQDLMAVETIDESQMPEDDDDDDEEDDEGSKDGNMSWTNQLSLDSFQYISQVLSYGGPFRCEQCGLHSASLAVYKTHRRRCCRRRGGGEQRPEDETATSSPLVKGEAGDVKTTTAATSWEGGAARSWEEGGAAQVKLEEDSSSLPGGSSSGQMTAAVFAVKSEPTVAGQVRNRPPFGYIVIDDSSLFTPCYGSGMFIPDPDFYPSRILDFTSWI